MPKSEFMRMPLKLIPDKNVQEYDLLSIVNGGWVYIKIAKGIYGLPQAGKLANDLLKKCLATTLVSAQRACEGTSGDQYLLP